MKWYISLVVTTAASNQIEGWSSVGFSPQTYILKYSYMSVGSLHRHIHID